MTRLARLTRMARHAWHAWAANTTRHNTHDIQHAKWPTRHDTTRNIPDIIHAVTCGTKTTKNRIESTRTRKRIEPDRTDECLPLMPSSGCRVSWAVPPQCAKVGCTLAARCGSCAPVRGLLGPGLCPGSCTQLAGAVLAFRSQGCAEDWAALCRRRERVFAGEDRG